MREVVLVAVRDAVGEVRLGLGEAPLGRRARRRGWRTPGRPGPAARARARSQRPLQQRPPLRVEAATGAGLGVQRVAEDVDGAPSRPASSGGPPGQPDRLAWLAADIRIAARVPYARASSTVGPSGSRMATAACGGGHAVLAPAQAAQRPATSWRVALALAHRSPAARQSARRPARWRRPRPASGRAGRPRRPAPSSRSATTSAGATPARTAAPARTAPPPRGASPSSAARRPAARRVPEHRRRVAGRLGVEGQPGVVVAAGAPQRGQDPGVRCASRRCAGTRLLDRQPGDLVPEPQPTAPSPTSRPEASSSSSDRRPGSRRPRPAPAARAGCRAARRASSTARAASPSRAARASTASRADGGTSPPPARSTSVT